MSEQMSNRTPRTTITSSYPDRSTPDTGIRGAQPKIEVGTKPPPPQSSVGNSGGSGQPSSSTQSSNQSNN